jgi:hypothetical protein
MSSHPDFICVGAQKAATTWLYDVLSRTPGIYLPRIKELHYFSELYSVDAKRFGPKHRADQIAHIRKFHKSRNTGTDYERMVLDQLDHIESNELTDEWYKHIFSYAHDNEIIGEICPCYMALPVRGVRHVMSINPLMRILIVVRDPIDRLWSHMRMHSKSGYMKLNPEAVLRGDVEMGPYLRYTDYATAIPRWQAMAGTDRVKVMLYDEIRNDAPAAVQDIFSFIGMPDAETKADLHQSIFSGQKMNMPTELHALFLEMLAPQYEYLADMFPQQTQSWLTSHRTAIRENTPV